MTKHIAAIAFVLANAAMAAAQAFPLSDRWAGVLPAVAVILYAVAGVKRQAGDSGGAKP